MYSQKRSSKAKHNFVIIYYVCYLESFVARYICCHKIPVFIVSCFEMMITEIHKEKCA